MALSHDWLLHSASFLWIFTLLLGDSHSKKTQTYYMEGIDCGDTKTLGGAVVFSHRFYTEQQYNNNVECRMTFKAQNEGWKLMLRILELDIPDRMPNGLCNDALYVYDDMDVFTKAMADAGGNGGLCGHLLPPALYSSGEYLTLHFRSNTKGKRGGGFKFIITSYSDDYGKYKSCGSSFLCDNKKCVDEDLLCDKVDHCGDYSDESTDGLAQCGKEDNGIISKFLTLGVTAAVAIIVGSIIVIIVCIIAIVCCCKRSTCRNSTSEPGGNTTTTTSTSISNGAPGFNQGKQETVHVSGQSGHHVHHPMVVNPFNNHAHQGYFPMQPIYPSPHGSVYSGYRGGEQYPHSGSGYSSQVPSYHRSYTPTSSKSGKSNRSNTSNSVTYSQNTEKVMLPVNL